jgi:hypothetical protein
MSYFGWNGKDDLSTATKFLAALVAFRDEFEINFTNAD